MPYFEFNEDISVYEFLRECSNSEIEEIKERLELTELTCGYDKNFILNKLYDAYLKYDITISDIVNKIGLKDFKNFIESK